MTFKIIIVHLYLMDILLYMLICNTMDLLGILSITLLPLSYNIKRILIQIWCELLKFYWCIYILSFQEQSPSHPCAINEHLCDLCHVQLSICATTTVDRFISLHCLSKLLNWLLATVLCSWMNIFITYKVFSEFHSPHLSQH